MNIMFFFQFFGRFWFDSVSNQIFMYLENLHKVQTEPTILAWFGQLFQFGPKFAQPYKTVSYQGCLVEDYG